MWHFRILDEIWYVLIGIYNDNINQTHKSRRLNIEKNKIWFDFDLPILSTEIVRSRHFPHKCVHCSATIFTPTAKCILFHLLFSSFEIIAFCWYANEKNETEQRCNQTKSLASYCADIVHSTKLKIYIVCKKIHSPFLWRNIFFMTLINQKWKKNQKQNQSEMQSEYNYYIFIWSSWIDFCFHISFAQNPKRNRR